MYKKVRFENNKQEMDMLPWIFRSCKVSGVWYDDSSRLFLKIMYSGLVGFLIINFLLSQLIEIMTTSNTLKEASELLFASFNFISTCLKILNIISRRNTLQNLLNDFRAPICQSKSSEEKAIISRHKDFSSKVFMGFCGIALSTCVTVSFVVPFLSDELRLPFRGYQVLNISRPINFAVAYSLQFFGVFYGVLVDATLDSLAYGFIILATGQVEVNCHRILNSTVPLKTCIEHQILMCNVVDQIQSFFIPAVVPQFFFSLTTVCTSIFLMSQMSATDPEFVGFGMCFTVMLSQVFLYCWFGNELKLKNEELADAVYTRNWTSCNAKERKNLWFVMLYAERATTISFHGQSALTLDTFSSIAKTSYAVFNLLRKSTN